ncbi:tyrosine protein phosphatase [Alkalihalobacillus alcalophilus ATCC 27647 = CGMCC 1.3604]|uniref:Tyrosine-protein phosphatase n=1 Tax=Alkalihalobacillus alcalophilus ATCC 27647 = CGMCC 1.3604 TaxID=1218173 RepID=A0A094WHK7_ALKAL|nr:CpsB/CapC family capsule biosynthesis tyrosine phosphatase [Alkalihalobacillus alcalophilus]KGA96276.1 tyrosine protein phosphatase [Alkalihalobacillus alcalophilus ATCC 27647 = CGMCC 1.3604]MED1563377.1 tyrosine protein phosphatase [Alkalihalobacillus alcalophilus]THG91656.1 tyrosine protein phosphatase [Alkalihalobacillus alcalophilus ATCC 27647 = CGMCC 1.3604]
MIDLHCHILSELDDGPKTIEESLLMAEAAVKEGITSIVATPHYAHPSFSKNEAKRVKVKVKELNQELSVRNIPLIIYPGHELRIHGELVEELTNDTALTMAGLGTYVFIEFSSNHVPRYAASLFYQLQVAGYYPVIVHPERNSELVQNPTLIYDFVKSGVYTQITASSLTGDNGKNIKKFTEQLIESNLTHFLASDAHNTTTRPFRMKEAYEEMKQEFGRATVELFQENAERLLENRALIVDDPEPIRRKKILGIF